LTEYYNSDVNICCSNVGNASMLKYPQYVLCYNHQYAHKVAHCRHRWVYCLAAWPTWTSRHKHMHHYT